MNDSKSGEAEAETILNRIEKPCPTADWQWRRCPNGHITWKQGQREPEPDMGGNYHEVWKCRECGEQGKFVTVFGGRNLKPENWEQVSPSWFQVNFPDKGSGATSIGSYIQALGPEHARSRAENIDSFNCYDSSGGSVTQVGDTFRDIALSVHRGGYNTAHALNGVTISSSDTVA